METTNKELALIKDRVMSKLAGMSTRLTDHDTEITLLHEGQMHLEHNLKMPMIKMGVTPSNSLPLDAMTQSVVGEGTSGTQNTTYSSDSAVNGCDLGEDFESMEREFDKELKDCYQA